MRGYTQQQLRYVDNLNLVRGKSTLMDQRTELREHYRTLLSFTHEQPGSQNLFWDQGLIYDTATWQIRDGADPLKSHLVTVADAVMHTFSPAAIRGLLALETMITLLWEELAKQNLGFGVKSFPKGWYWVDIAARAHCGVDPAAYYAERELLMEGRFIQANLPGVRGIDTWQLLREMDQQDSVRAAKVRTTFQQYGIVPPSYDPNRSRSTGNPTVLNFRKRKK